MKNSITAAGGLFLARSTGRLLLLLRSQGRTSGTWGLAGGKQEPEDTGPYQALIREIEEELGEIPTIEKTIPIELYHSPDDSFFYNTYVLIVADEFVPRLNQEHVGWAWVAIDQWPRPLHQGVKTTLSSRTTRAKLETILELI